MARLREAIGGGVSAADRVERGRVPVRHDVAFGGQANAPKARQDEREQETTPQP
jgi:hypothetical protein